METSNEIVLENQKQGTPESVWRVLNGDTSSIQGFTTDISTNVGGTVNFKIDTDSDSYRIDIYRLGYYDGDGARLVGSINHNGAVNQPGPIVDFSTGTVDAGNWSVTDSWTTPTDAVSGVYIAKLVREDGIVGENHIPFIVRDDDGGSDVLFQTSDTTWQAYNNWGGANVYGGTVGPAESGGRAYAVSYNRPIATDGLNTLLQVEVSAIRWLEKNGYDVSYISGVDTARAGGELLEHQVFLSVGHDEYWSAEARDNVEAARDAGVNLAFLSGNEVFWKTRWEPSLDSSQTDWRTMVAYKETYPWPGLPDPSPIWTGAWRDPKSPDGSQPENALSGSIFMVDGQTQVRDIQVPYAMSRFHFWDNTSIADQGGTLYGLLGYEWNVDADNGSRPDGLIHLSSTTTTLQNGVLPNNYSSVLGTPGVATHNLTLYKADSGALVFGAGTIFWAWGLDDHHSGYLGQPNPVPDLDVQQAMVNLFAEMGIQPQSLQSNLVLGVQSNDHTAPQADVLRGPLSGAVFAGSQIQLLGSAEDFGGGVVAAVEISTDKGLTWHMASGWEDWSYSWIPNKIGAAHIEVRAIDDSLNVGTATDIGKVFVAFQHPGFDPGYYLSQNPDVAAVGADPWIHFLNLGWKEGRDPNAEFSVKYYLDANPDIALKGINPLVHFELAGWKEGRNPSQGFDVEKYLSENPDVRAAGFNPLDHFLIYGLDEGRVASNAIGKSNLTGFNPEYYLLHNPDLIQVKIDPYLHYALYGAAEGRDPNAFFDASQYMAQNPDVAASGIDPYTHYLEFGWKEGRNPSDDFDTEAYLQANPDVAATGVDPLLHYLLFGVYEGRDPHGNA
jgi:N,N-dimethylformamidase beta subunit-like, C-terminal